MKRTTIPNLQSPTMILFVCPLDGLRIMTNTFYMAGNSCPMIGAMTYTTLLLNPCLLGFEELVLMFTFAVWY